MIGVDKRLATRSAWLVALCPLLILYCISILRDWLIAIAIALAVLSAFQLAKKPFHLISILLMSISFSMLYNLRPLTILLFIISAAAWYILAAISSTQNRLPRIVVGSFVAVSVALVLSLILAQHGFAINAEDLWQKQTRTYSTDYYAQNRSNSELSGHNTFLAKDYGSGNAGDVPQAISLNPQNMLTAILRSFLEPTPFWAFTVLSGSSFIHFLPGVYWYFLLPAFLVGLWSAFRLWKSINWLPLFVLLAFLLSSVSIMGLATDPIRARVQVLPLMYIAAGYGLLRLKVQPVLRHATIAAAGIFYTALAFFYFLGTYLPWPAMHPFSLLSMAGLAILIAALANRRAVQ